MAEINKHKRALYERSFIGLGKICLKLGLTPNILTALSFIFAIVSGIYFWKTEIWWGIFWMLIASLADILDGSTARAGNIGTIFGGILDHVSDRYGEFFILDYNEFLLKKMPFYSRIPFKLIECPYAFDFIEKDWKEMLAGEGFSSFEEHLFFGGYIRLLKGVKVS